MPSIDEITKKYIELRDRKSEIAKKHQEELAPYNQAMDTIESYLMDQMNRLGVTSFKTAFGTPYKANNNSVKLQDPHAFKSFVLQPAVDAINHYLHATGHSIQQADLEAIASCLQEQIKWDMVDFRAGKKGVLEHLETTSQLPPGVAVETFSVVNVRRD